MKQKLVSFPYKNYWNVRNKKATLCPIFQTSFDALEREIRAEIQNLHRFLDEEEYRDLEHLRRERQKQLKQLKERERKIAGQGRDLEKAIAVLNNKLCDEDSPKLLKVSRVLSCRWPELLL